MSPGYPLEPDPSQMAAMTEAVRSALERLIEELPEAPASDLDGALELAREIRGPAPAEGGDMDELVELLVRGARKAFNTAGPGYLAFVPGGGLYTAALGEFMAAGMNRFVAVWNAAPALAQVEWTALGWLFDLFGYPESARGVFTSGGSLSNFSAIVTARELLGEDFLDGVMYVTEQTHASVAKSARLAGIPAGRIRPVPAGDDLRMDPSALEAMIADDRAAGLRPFLVVPSAGTTNTGVVDPLGEVVEIGHREGVWVHVDAAYGGFFQLTERGRRRFEGIDAADSITLDPHKAMFLPYGTGTLLVREGTRLREAHHVGAAYLQDIGGEEEIPNFAEYSPELSRSFRGLSLWLPVMLHGLDAFREALDEKLDLARLVYEELRAAPGFELPWEPELSTVAFRYVPASGDEDAFNEALLERINASRRVFLSSTRIRGRYWIRVCIVSHRTHRDRIEEAVEIMRSAARELSAAQPSRST